MGSGASVPGGKNVDSSMENVSVGQDSNSQQSQNFCPPFSTWAHRRARRRPTLELEADLHFGVNSDRSKAIESRGSWKRTFSLSGAANPKHHEFLHEGASIDRTSPVYDPLLVFKIDTTVLAAINVQRLVRGYMVREAFRKNMFKKSALNPLDKLPVPANLSPSTRSPQADNSSEPGTSPSTSPPISTTPANRFVEEGSPSHHTLNLIEAYRQKAINARRAGDTKLALDYMAMFKTLKQLIEGGNVPLEGNSMDGRSHNYQKSLSEDLQFSPVRFESLKRKAISARKLGKNDLALQYMTEYNYMISSMKGTGEGGDGSQSGSPLPAKHPTPERNIPLDEQIRLAKLSAISAKRDGQNAEAVFQMKRYKSLLATKN